MFRLFDEHLLRSSRTLDGVWQLTLLDGTERVFPAIVPGIWEAIPALARYRGKARYERTFLTAKDGNLLLRFGVDQTLSTIIITVLITALRIMATVFKWNMPQAKL